MFIHDEMSDVDGLKVVTHRYHKLVHYKSIETNFLVDQGWFYILEPGWTLLVPWPGPLRKARATIIDKLNRAVYSRCRFFVDDTVFMNLFRAEINAFKWGTTASMTIRMTDDRRVDCRLNVHTLTSEHSES